MKQLNAKEITQFYNLSGKVGAEKSILISFIYLLALTVDPEV